MRTDPNALRARLANFKRYHPDEVDTIAGMRRDYHVARLEAHIQRVVDEAPSLTVEQRGRLSALLRGDDDLAGRPDVYPASQGGVSG